MPSTNVEATDDAGYPAAVRRQMRKYVALLLAGVLGGAGLSLLLDPSAVAVPAVGTVPGQVVGLLGLLGAAGTYHQFGCCGAADCGCGDDCGDRCSYGG